jgi:PAS domain S-box-containing protein
MFEDIAGRASVQSGSIEAEHGGFESEDLYRKLFESAGMGMAFIAPEDGIITLCNRAYAEVLRSTPEKLSGRSFFEFLDEVQEAKARRERELRVRGVPSEYEITATAADGSERRLLATGAPLHADDGSYLGAVQTLLDITEQRRAEEALRESERRYRELFELAPVGLAQVAPDGRWLRVNRKLCELSGYSREELLALTYLDLTPPEDLEESLESAGKLLRGEIGPYTVERRYVRKDGRHIWVRLKVSLVRELSGESSYFTCAAEDITARKLEELLPEPLKCGELRVLRLVAAGWTNRQIAKELRYSLGGIKHHIQRIIAKLGVEDRAEAASRAISIGLIQPPE